MVNLGNNYDPNAHEPNQAFEPLPAGWYAMQIIATEMVVTKDGQGQYLKLTLEIMESQHPEHKGRQCWDRLNLLNKNAQAVDIANRTLSAICHSIGQMGEWNDTDVLHHRPLAVKLLIKPADGQYDANNEIKGYDAFAGRIGGSPSTAPLAAPGTVQQATQAPAQAPQGQPGQAATPPWQQK